MRQLETEGPLEQDEDDNLKNVTNPYQIVNIENGIDSLKPLTAVIEPDDNQSVQNAGAILDRSFDGDSINANTVQNNSIYGGSAFNSIDARSYTSQKQILAIGSLKLPQTYDPSLENQKMTEAVKHELEEKKEKERKLAERELRENTVYPGEVTEEPD